nr:uncharacterized protein LOC105857868 [Microcebus murinus]
MATVWLPPSGKRLPRPWLPKAITATPVCEEGPTGHICSHCPAWVQGEGSGPCESPLPILPRKETAREAERGGTAGWTEERGTSGLHSERAARLAPEGPASSPVTAGDSMRDPSTPPTPPCGLFASSSPDLPGPGVENTAGLLLGPVLDHLVLGPPPTGRGGDSLHTRHRAREEETQHVWRPMEPAPWWVRRHKEHSASPPGLRDSLVPAVASHTLDGPVAAPTCQILPNVSGWDSLGQASWDVTACDGGGCGSCPHPLLRCHFLQVVSPGGSAQNSDSRCLCGSRSFVPEPLGRNRVSRSSLCTQHPRASTQQALGKRAWSA